MRYTVLVILVALPAGLALDYDFDGVGTINEWRYGSSGLNQDTDGDGLPDGWEIRRGLPPGDADADDDGLHDGDEYRIRSDLLNPDMDGDGVLDGDEGAIACLLRPDCDQDALPDAKEVGGFDALRSDSFGSGLDDGVVWTFQQQGDEASGDEDGDGIPDAWELQSALIDWGPFEPQPGRRDMLVEYLKVVGPNSGRFDLDFTPAYEAVADLFAEGDVHMKWIETVVELDEEYRPGFFEEADQAYVESVLAAGKGSSNPYVTSVLLNPQQEQEDLRGNVLGAAFLRSMIATVDYGSHTSITMREQSGEGLTLSGSIDISPSLESHVIGARPEQVRQLAFASEGIVDLGVRNDGELYIVTRNDGDEFTWIWTPDWFQRAPRITTGDAWLQLRATGATIDTASLASTIAHELGHTLGLCHAHEPTCFQQFSLEDARNRHDSTMSYDAPSNTLYFLPSEWEQLQVFLTCPPQEPLLTLALGGDVYRAKYEASFSEVVRTCQNPIVIDANLPNTPLSDRPAGILWLALFGAGTLGLAAITWVRR